MRTTKVFAVKSSIMWTNEYFSSLHKTIPPRALDVPTSETCVLCSGRRKGTHESGCVPLCDSYTAWVQRGGNIQSPTPSGHPAARVTGYPSVKSASL